MSTQNEAQIHEPDFIIDPEFRDLLPPTGDMANNELSREIIDNNGPEHDLIVWAEENILIDGHRRYAICKEHGVPYLISRRSFSSRDEVKMWMIRRQLQRRNLSDHDTAIFTARLAKNFKKQGETAFVQKTAEATGQSVRSVHRASEYEKALGMLHPDWQAATKERTGGMKLPQSMVLPLAKLDHDTQLELLNACFEADGIGPLREQFKKTSSKTSKEPRKRGKGEPVRKLSHDEMEAKLVESPTLPPDVPSVMPGANDPVNAKDIEPKSPKEIVAMVDECEKLCGPFSRSLDSIFGDQGLGIEYRSSGWKRRVDHALRQIAIVLKEVRDLQ